MRRFYVALPACLLAGALQGCAMLGPSPVVTGPLSAVPEVAAAPAPEPDGAIYQAAASGHHPLFEDRRPRNVGDIVTVVIQEKTNAAKSVQTSTDRSGKAGYGIGVSPSLLPDVLGASQAFDMTGQNAATGKGLSRADNMFSGALTTTVIDVLPNGNLRIAGEKQMGINRGSEHIRFSGVIDPRSITGGNTVLSTHVADARIEFRSKGSMDEVQSMGWLQRFFLRISPF